MGCMLASRVLALHSELVFVFDWHANACYQTCTDDRAYPLMLLQDPIVTEMADVNGFTSAESYHQQYLERGGRFGKAQSAEKGCDDPIRCYG